MRGLSALLKPASSAATSSYGRTPANYRPLTPVSFLSWAASAYPETTAVLYGEAATNYSALYERCCRLAGALNTHGVRPGDTVAVIAANIPALLELHYGVPMAGAVIAPMNPGREVATLAYMLEHSDAKMLFVDQAYTEKTREALRLMKRPLKLIVDIADTTLPPAPGIGKMQYEQFLQDGSANYEWPGVEDEWDTLALCYTLGTEGLPKGVLLHHRGGFLDATGEVFTSGLRHGSVYLWTLPMYLACGWGYAYAVTAVGGTHVLLRDNENGDAIFSALHKHGVTHMSGKHGFLDILDAAKNPRPLSSKTYLDIVETGNSPEVAARLEKLGLDITFLYGLTESYGPAGKCHWKGDPGTVTDEEILLASTAAHFPTLDRLIVADRETLDMLPQNGKAVGEVLLRGNTLFKGYHKDPELTERSLRGGWFHTGDLGVIHPDGRLEFVERVKEKPTAE